MLKKTALALLCTLTTALTVGCKQKQKRGSMLLDGQIPITIPIELKNSNKPLELAQYIDTMLFVPLETNDSVFVSRIGIVELFGDRIFYLNDITPQAYSFNMQGKFLAKLIQPGMGPKEITRAFYMHIDRANELLIFCDRARGTLHLVSLEGEYIKEVKAKRWVHAIYGIGNQESYLMMADEEEHKLFLAQNNFKSFKPIEEISLDAEEFYASGSSKPLSSLFNGSVNLSVGYSQSIINFNDSIFYQKYFFDFGKLHIPPEIKGLARLDAMDDRTKKYVGGIFGFKETRNHLVFHFNTSFSGGYTALITKPSMEVKLFNSISFAGFLFNRNTWFTNANADDWFLGVIFDYKEDILESSAECAGLTPQEQRLRDAVLKREITDNPIYVFFKLKDNF